MLRADDISGSKTALAIASLMFSSPHVLLSPPSLQVPTANRLLYPHTAPFNASPVHSRRLLSDSPLDLDHRPTSFWKHAARRQQRQRRRRNPRRSFAPRVPVK